MDAHTSIAARTRSDEFLETALSVGVGARCDAMMELARRADPDSPRVAAAMALQHENLGRALRSAAAARSRWEREGAADPLHDVISGLIDFSLGRQHRVVEMVGARKWPADMPAALAASLTRLWWASAASIGSIAGVKLATAFAESHGISAPAEEAWIEPIMAGLTFQNPRPRMAKAMERYPGVAAYLAGGSPANLAFLLPNGAVNQAVCGAVVAKGILVVPGLSSCVQDDLDMRVA